MKERTKKISVIIVGLFLVSIMLASVLNFSLSFNQGSSQNQQQGFEYNGYEFFQTNNGGWVTEIDGIQIALTYNPQQLEDFFLDDVDLTTLRFSEKTYLSLDINNVNLAVAASDLTRTLAFPRIVQACPEDLPGCENLPLRTCQDSTSQAGVIYLKEGETDIMQVENNCLFMQAAQQDIIRLVDKLVYKELGIA